MLIKMRARVESRWGSRMVSRWDHLHRETYKNHVRLTFAKGASLKDSKHLFNASLEGKAFRAIVIHEKDRINETAFKNLIREAVSLNLSKKKNK